MSALAVGEAIRRPGELKLPPQVADVMAHLNPDGRAQYVDELLRAIEEAERIDDLRPVRDVIEAWFRTLMVRHHPDYVPLMGRTTTGEPRERLTGEQFRERCASTRGQTGP